MNKRPLLKWFASYGLGRGLRRGSRAWLVAGGVAWVLHHLGARRPVVDRQQLLPGQTLVVSHVEETAKPSRRERRKSAVAR